MTINAGGRLLDFNAMAFPGRRITFEITSGQQLIRLDPPWQVPYESCEHCGASKWHEQVALSIEEAIGFGWLVPA